MNCKNVNDNELKCDHLFTIYANFVMFYSCDVFFNIRNISFGT